MAFGQVCEINKDKGFVKLNVNGRVTNWLPCLNGTPSLSQQVAFLEFSNDGTGVVLGSLSRVDGNPISLHIGSTDIWCDGNTTKIKSPNTKIIGDVSIDGTLKVTKNIETEQEVLDTKGNLTNFTTTDGAKRK